MRGLQVKTISEEDFLGITPAYAGTTPANLNASPGLKDHPCICGDYYMIDGDKDFLLGSPLHMRGLLV